MSSSMSHQRAKELLDASLHDSLISFESAVLDHHLNNCTACRKYAQELLDFDHSLYEKLQDRWPTPTIRQADIDSVLEKVQGQKNFKVFTARASAILQPVLALTAVAILTISFIWTLNNYAGQSSSFDQPAGSSETGSGDALLTSLYQLSDIDCSGSLERINLIRKDQGVYQPIIGVSIEEIIDGSPQLIWEFYASQVGETEIDHVFLIKPNDLCQKLVGILVGTGSPRFVVFTWENGDWEQILNTPGYPQNLTLDRFILHLDESNQLEIKSTENINSAKCSTVTTTYTWDGRRFIPDLTILAPGTGCLDNR